MQRINELLEEATIRFAGDSGDGMQLAGTQFSETSGFVGNEVNTFPDYPSEIRAPEGTLYGVSAFQIHFGTRHIHTSGDQIDVLFAMNAASLKVNLANVKPGGIIIADAEGFSSRNLTLANYTTDPLKDGSLQNFQVQVIDFQKEIKSELQDLPINNKLIGKTKNLFALGISYWLFQRPMEPTVNWINKKFKGKDDVILANIHVLRAGWNYAQRTAAFDHQYSIAKAELPPGRYRNMTGNEAVALALVVAARRAQLPLFLGSYPITPATDILHAIAGLKKYGVRHLQAEDEIAGICSAIGAAFGGALAATTTSGPGLSLKTEALGLAVMTELPLIVVDVQRAGPSTGLPTKPEQSDLFIAMFGRHGEAPMPVLAAASPTDCFDMTLEAARLALKYMTPVLLLSDGQIGQSAEPWRIPALQDLPVLHTQFARNSEGFAPYHRDPATLGRNWAIPGVKGLEHRIGGLEKADGSGQVSHDPLNHEHMVRLRSEKIARIATDIPELVVEGEQQGEFLLLSWGSTYGPAKTAWARLRNAGRKISFAHLRYLNPFPANLEKVLHSFQTVLVPELNSGQLKFILQGTFRKEILGFSKVQGKPFRSTEIETEILNHLVQQETSYENAY